jgi:3-mercaptopyruvate sulfurtransferase SseA
MNFLKFISLCLIFINVELESKAVNDLIVNVEILNQTNSPLTTVTNKEPDLKWLETKDLIELVSYLMHQEKSNTTTQSNILIDSRDSNEYNGWKSFQNNQSDLLSFYDEKNGHVSFAHNFDADWIDTVDQNQLDSFLVERFGLTPISEQKTQQPPKDRLIIYDTNILRLEKVKNYLMNKFLVHTTYLCRIEEDEIGKLFQKTNATTNNIFFQEPFYDMLISPEILNAIIRPNLDEKNVVTVNPLVEYKICEVGVDNTQDHIPSAVRLNMNELEDSVSRTRKNATEISKLLLGI